MRVQFSSDGEKSRLEIHNLFLHAFKVKGRAHPSTHSSFFFFNSNKSLVGKKNPSDEMAAMYQKQMGAETGAFATTKKVNGEDVEVPLTTYFSVGPGDDKTGAGSSDMPNFWSVAPSVLLHVVSLIFTIVTCSQLIHRSDHDGHDKDDGSKMWEKYELHTLYEFSAWYAMFGQGGCVLLGFLYYGIQEKSMKGMVCGWNCCTYWPHFIPTVLLGLYFMVLVCLNYLVLWTPLKEEEHRDKNMDGMFMVSLFLAALAFFNLIVTPISGMAAVRNGVAQRMA